MSDTTETTKVMYFNPPIEFGPSKFDQLDLREPTAGEWVKAETHKTGRTMLIALIALVSKWPAPAVHELPESKFWEAASFLNAFSPRAPQIGET